MAIINFFNKYIGFIFFILISTAIILGFLNSGCDMLCMTAHSEALGLATFGKFQNRFLPVDAFSGDAFIYYNPLSGYLVSLVANVLNVPVIHLMFIIGQAILPAIFVAIYISLRLIKIGSVSASIAAVTATLFTDIITFHTIINLPIPEEFAAKISYYRLIFHTPFNSSHIATANSFAYILIAPSIAFFLRFYESRRATNLFYFSIFSSALILCHSLSGMSVFFGIAVAIVGIFASSSKRLLGTLAVSAFVGIAIAAGNNSIYLLALSGFIISIFALMTIGFYKSLIVLMPLISAALYIFFSILASGFFETGKTSTQSGAPLGWLLLCFLPQLMMSRLATRPILFVSILICAGVFALANGGMWGMNNHSYRFATYMGIFLAFPVAFSLDYFRWNKGQWAGVLLAFVMSSTNLIDLYLGPEKSFINGRRTNAVYGEPYLRLTDGEHDLLLKVKELTSNGSARFLNFPPLHYPSDPAVNGIMLSYSHTPGLVPDLRYTGLAQNTKWLNVFCGLFDLQNIQRIGYSSPYFHIEELVHFFETCSVSDAYEIPSHMEVYLLFGKGNLAGSVKENDLRPDAPYILNRVFANSAGTIYSVTSYY